MTHIRIVGTWRNTGDPPSELPLAAALVDHAWRPNERDKVSAYLSCGHPVEWLADWWTCELVEGDPAALGDTYLTDGYWLWPSALSILVKEYGVRLPDEVADDMKSRGYILPNAEWAEERSAAGEYDRDFWREWAANIDSVKKGQGGEK